MNKMIAIIEIGSNNTKTHVYENNELVYDNTTTIEFKKNYNKNKKVSTDDLKKLYEAWKRGNEKEIAEIAIEEADESIYSEADIKIMNDVSYKMLDERNVGMANKLKEYFNDNKKVFYMVGAAHLVGDHGIANLLKQDGYTVKIIK